ncbi:MAG TPA: DUF2293 domain-containing protein [Chitinivibrionales bacterium]|nr:DUF2293 domain-containing protein [Chitinivibrionales bacterium]
MNNTKEIKVFISSRESVCGECGENLGTKAWITLDQFAEKIREYFPACPKSREHDIAQFACLKYSGRIGRSAGAKEFGPQAINLAVRAHIRHTLLTTTSC